jgi:hypothetical protein
MSALSSEHLGEMGGLELPLAQCISRFFGDHVLVEGVSKDRRQEVSNARMQGLTPGFEEESVEGF